MFTMPGDATMIPHSMSLLRRFWRITFKIAFVGYLACLAVHAPSFAQQGRQPARGGSDAVQHGPANGLAQRDAALVKMLSGATLEGSFTRTAPSSDPTKLSRDKYTIGEVSKAGPGLWRISARIQYDEHDVTLPLILPIQWAGDTPVIVVDNVSLPGFGTVSARVMLFDRHYAGYWKHGQQSGHLFGIIRPAQTEPHEPPDQAD